MSAFILRADSTRETITANLLRFLEKLPKDKPWEVRIDPFRESRSGRQNRALFGHAYIQIGDQTGITKNDLHEYMCGEYFGWMEVVVFGEKQKRPVRTTTTNELGQHDVLKKPEFAKFYEFIQMRAAENGLYVTDPDPLWRMAA